MEKKRFAVIGLGMWGVHHVEVYSRHPSAELSAICDIDREKATTAAKKFNVRSFYTDYDEMFQKEKIDAVSVVLPDFAHRDAVIAAVRAGKDVLVEKPFATTVEDCTAMVEAASEAGRKIMVDFHSRWIAPFLGAKKNTKAGLIGNPMHAYIRLSDTIMCPRKLLSWLRDSSPLWFLGSHCIDLLRWILEDEVKKVYAVSQNRVLKSEGMNCPDYFQVLMEFRNGASAVMENSWILPDSSPAIIDFRLDLVGSKGAIHVNAAHHGALRVYTDQPSSSETIPHFPSPDLFFVSSVHEHPAGGAIEAIEHFVEAICRNEEPAVTYNDGLEVAKVTAAILKSVETGRAIEVS